MDADAGPASIVSFAIGGIVSSLAALSMSELATGMPRAGGIYYYINRTLAPLAGSITAFRPTGAIERLSGGEEPPDG